MFNWFTSCDTQRVISYHNNWSTANASFGGSEIIFNLNSMREGEGALKIRKVVFFCFSFLTHFPNLILFRLISHRRFSTSYTQRQWAFYCFRIGVVVIYSDLTIGISTKGAPLRWVHEIKSKFILWRRKQFSLS